MTSQTSEGTERGTVQGGTNFGGVRNLTNATTRRFGNQTLRGYGGADYNYTTD